MQPSPPAFEACRSDGLIPEHTKLRQVKYLNNIIEQDHRFSKRRIMHIQWLQTFDTAEATIAGYEAMHMIQKGQVKGVGKKTDKSYADKKEHLEIRTGRKCSCQRSVIDVVK